METIKKNWREKLPYKTQLPRALEKSNEVFRSLPLMDQRKEIALDVIHLISTKIIAASCGYYWDGYLDSFTRSSGNAKDFQKNLKKLHHGEECYVCARGAMMLSTIRIGNQIDPTKFDREKITEGRKETQRYFAPAEYERMEDIYENGYTEFRDVRYRALYECNSEESLLNIFLQVIYTGKFLPKDVNKDWLEESNILLPSKELTLDW